NRNDVEVLTAGILGLSGLGATQEVKEILSREGIDVSAHTSRQVTWDMLKQSEFILVMERIHEEKILQIAPEVRGRIFLLKEFAKIIDTDLDIPDPIGRSKEFYEQTFYVIKEAVERVSKII
ncbi:MAG: hypothetical protein N2Z79_00645, partial [Candidatus Omnitrophica bacterium]|nr:hypothetical protein [Candidatus Omnitrophota bacterium]